MHFDLPTKDIFVDGCVLEKKRVLHAVTRATCRAAYQTENLEGAEVSQGVMVGDAEVKNRALGPRSNSPVNMKWKVRLRSFEQSLIRATHTHTHTHTHTDAHTHTHTLTHSHTPPPDLPAIHCLQPASSKRVFPFSPKPRFVGKGRKGPKNK